MTYSEACPRRCLKLPSRTLADPDLVLPRRAALLAVYAAEAMLLAFMLKMKVAAALRSAGGGSGSRPAASSVGYVGHGYAERAADFLGNCLPSPGAAAGLYRIVRLKVAIRFSPCDLESSVKRGSLLFNRSMTAKIDLALLNKLPNDQMQAREQLASMKRRHVRMFMRKASVSQEIRQQQLRVVDAVRRRARRGRRCSG